MCRVCSSVKTHKTGLERGRRDYKYNLDCRSGETGVFEVGGRKRNPTWRKKMDWEPSE